MSESPLPASHRWSPRNFWPTRAGVLFALIAGFLAAAAYVNALHNPFVFDDRIEILENPSIRHLADWPAVLHHSLTRPVTNLSYALDFAASGLEPFGYHLTNLLLHVVNVFVLFVLVRHLTEDFGGAPATSVNAAITAFTAAGVFAVHPMMTEAVGYVSGRAEVLCATFFLASFYCFRRSLEDRGGRIIAPRLAGIAFFVLALATKETAVTLPAVLLAYDMLRVSAAGNNWRARFWKLHAPLNLTVLIVAAARIWFYTTVEHPAAAGFDWRNVLIELHVIERYLSLLLVPVSQSIVHSVYPFESPFDGRLITAASILGIALAVAILARKRDPLVTFGTIWFILVLMPSASLSLLTSIGQPMAEHRVYLASCGFFMISAVFVSNFLRSEASLIRGRGVAINAVLTVVLGTLTMLTIARNRVWSDPVRLFEDAARKAPSTWVAHYGIADSYRAQGNCEAALPSYRRAIALVPENADGYLGLAACSMELGHRDAARTALREAVTRAPTEVRPKLALAALEEQVFNRPDEAVRLCRDALALAPGLQEAERCIVRNGGGQSPPSR